MKICFLKEPAPSDVWVVPFWQGPKEAAEISLKIEGALDDFKGKNGETALYYAKGQRILLLGLGQKEKASVEELRKAYAAAVKTLRDKKIKEVDLFFPKCKQPEKFLQGMGEGVFLSNYSFSYKQKDQNPLLEKVTFVGVEGREFVEELLEIANGVCFVRDLVNANADEKLQQVLEAAKKLAPKVKLTLFDKKRLEKEGMGLLLAVSRGSSVDPALVQLTYNGNPKSEERVVLVGKGVLYDTGGLSLKPTDNMLTMKSDMAGAATVLGAIKTAAELKLKVNVTVLLPLAENCIDAKSYKLGDVYRSYSGKMVEITNTDAEGRLVLADAIAYAAKNLAPSAIVDLATLTGACVIALGDDIAGLFCEDDLLAESLLEASEVSDELLWRMPMHKDYFENYKSEIADMVNSGGREGGAIKAALFLHQFAGEIPFAHIDIAGPSYLSKPKHYNPTKATGYGLRLLIEFLRGFES